MSKRNLATILLVAIAFVLITTGTASAEDIFTTVEEKGKEVFKAVKNVIFIVGGFGLVGLATAAIFGKVNWKWFSYLAVGLMILAAAGAIIDYATDSGNLNDNSGFGDTLGD